LIQGQLKAPGFAINMNVNYGYLVFGQTDNFAYDQSSMKSVSINTAGGYWRVDSCTFTAGSMSWTGNLIMDFATSYTELDGSLVDAYHAIIPRKVQDSKTKRYTVN